MPAIDPPCKSPFAPAPSSVGSFAPIGAERVPLAGQAGLGDASQMDLGSAQTTSAQASPSSAAIEKSIFFLPPGICGSEDGDSAEPVVGSGPPAPFLPPGICSEEDEPTEGSGSEGSSGSGPGSSPDPMAPGNESTSFVPPAVPASQSVSPAGVFSGMGGVPEGHACSELSNRVVGENAEVGGL